MLLTEDEKRLITSRRTKDLKRRGAISCWSCDGSGSYSQSDCDVCSGRGWHLKTSAAVRERVAVLRENKRAVSEAIKACR